MKVVTDWLGAQDLYASAKLLVERVHQAFALEAPHLDHDRQVDVDDLVEGVHARIRAAGSDDGGFVIETQGLGECDAKQSHDGVMLGLVGEPTKGLTVVGQVEAPPLGGA